MATTRLDDGQWSALRTSYEHGERTIADLARAYGISRQAVHKRLRADALAGRPWREPEVRPATSTTKGVGAERASIEERVQSNVVDIMTKRTLDKIGGADGIEATTDKLAAQITDVLDSQPALFAQLQEYAEAMIKRGIAGSLTLGLHGNEAEAFSSILAGTSRLMRDAREANGLKPGQASSAATAAASNRQRRFIFVLPKVAEPDPAPIAEAG